MDSWFDRSIDWLIDFLISWLIIRAIAWLFDLPWFALSFLIGIYIDYIDILLIYILKMRFNVKRLRHFCFHFIVGFPVVGGRGIFPSSQPAMVRQRHVSLWEICVGSLAAKTHCQSTIHHSRCSSFGWQNGADQEKGIYGTIYEGGGGGMLSKTNQIVVYTYVQARVVTWEWD